MGLAPAGSYTLVASYIVCLTELLLAVLISLALLQNETFAAASCVSCLKS